MKIDLEYDLLKEETYFYTLQSIDFYFNKKRFVIKKGFYSDGGSIPKFFLHRCRPLDARYITAFIKHDFGYVKKYTSRKKIDKILYEDLIKSGMDFLTAFQIYIAVRLFGKSFWKNC